MQRKAKVECKAKAKLVVKANDGAQQASEHHSDGESVASLEGIQAAALSSRPAPGSQRVTSSSQAVCGNHSATSSSQPDLGSSEDKTKAKQPRRTQANIKHDTAKAESRAAATEARASAAKFKVAHKQMLVKAKAQIQAATAEAKAQMKANVQTAKEECKTKLHQVIAKEKMRAARTMAEATLREETAVQQKKKIRASPWQHKSVKQSLMQTFHRISGHKSGLELNSWPLCLQARCLPLRYMQVACDCQVH